MTASLTIVLVCQTCMLVAVRHLGKGAGFWLTAAALMLLPLCFAPITAISHIVFEASPEWLFWAVFGLAGALLAAMLKSLVVGAGKGLPRPVVSGFGLATACTMLILLAGIPVHGRESGPTPTLIDSPFFVLTWASASLGVASIVWTIFWQAEPWSFARFVLVPALLAALVIELVSGI